MIDLMNVTKQYSNACVLKNIISRIEQPELELDCNCACRVLWDANRKLSKVSTSNCYIDLHY